MEEINPTISYDALDGISTPQTLEIEGYIKEKMLTLLIDFDSTYNFTHYKLVLVLNSFIYLEPNFKMTIMDEGDINLSRKCHNNDLSMEKYVLNSQIISIPMGGANFVLEV